MSARPFTSHNHASREAAMAECARAGMTPWHDRDWLLFAPRDGREHFAIACYATAAGPRWCIVPEATLRAHLENVAHALGQGPGSVPGCPVDAGPVAVHNEPAVSNSGGF